MELPASPGKILSEVTLMRKLFLVIPVLLLAVIIATSVQAETYEVRKGDSLWLISQRQGVSLESLWQANRDKISDKDTIYPGQKLKIPDGFQYLHPNANPFSSARDPARLIRKFDCPQEVKEEFLDIVRGSKNSNSQKYQVKKGDTLWKLENRFQVDAEKIYNRNRDVINHPKKWLFPGQELDIPGSSLALPVSGENIYLSSRKGHLSFLEQMGFGDYQVVDRVQVDFQEPQKAKRWRVKSENRDYFLVLPLNCYNWGWYKRSPKKKKYSVIILPRFFGPGREMAESVPSGPADHYPAKKHEWAPGADAGVYAGHYKGIQEENSENWHQYLGGHLYLFPDSYMIGEGRFRAGPAIHGLAWQGEADEAVEYTGDYRVAGLRAEYLREWSETTLTLAGGEKRGRVEGIGFPYRSREEADIMIAEGQHSWWYPRNWFRQMEVGFRAQISGNETKETHLLGEPVSDPAVDQGEYSARYKTDIYGHWLATPTMELAGGWRAFDRSAFFEPRAGIEWLQDTAATDVSYQMVEHSQNNMAAAHMRLDISKATKKLTQWITDS